MLHYYIAPGLSYNHLQGAIKKVHELKRATKVNINESYHIKAERIILIVSEYFKVTPENLKSASRRGNVKTARQIAMFLIRKLTILSFEKIGKLFSHRNHATVVYSCQTVEDLCSYDKRLRAQLEEIESYV